MDYIMGPLKYSDRGMNRWERMDKSEHECGYHSISVEVIDNFLELVSPSTRDLTV